MELSSAISTRLHYQHKVLVDIIEGLSDEQIRRNVITGKWSIFEHIVHLQAYQHTFIKRIRQIIEGDNPVFERYSAETDPLFLDNCHKSSREVLQDLITTRKQITAEIHHYTDANLKKCGEHPAFGKMNISEWLNFFLLHEAHHLFAIFKMAGILKVG
jgi:uncharacterized damage-inducible protein DinB